MVYASTLSESQQVMRWQLIIEEFGTNIQHISGFDNIVTDMLSRLSSTKFDKYKLITSKDHCHANKLSAIWGEENNKGCLPLNLLNVQIEQQKEPIKVNYKLSIYISDCGYGYSDQYINDVNIICYDRKIYVMKNMWRCVIYWYHLYFNNPCGSRLTKKSREVC